MGKPEPRTNPREDGLEGRVIQTSKAPEARPKVRDEPPAKSEAHSAAHSHDEEGLDRFGRGKLIKWRGGWRYGSEEGEVRECCCVKKCANRCIKRFHRREQEKKYSKQIGSHV